MSPTRRAARARPPAETHGKGSARGRAAAYVVGGLDQVRVLAHPLRLRLLEIFAKGAATTKQAAHLLGESPTRLYHHVYALERVGLVRLVETRPNRGTVEKYYRAVPGPLGIPVAPGASPAAKARARAGSAGTGARARTLDASTGTRAEGAKAAARLLELAEREFAAASSRPTARPEDPAPLLARLVVRGDATRIQRVRAELMRWIAEVGRDVGRADDASSPARSYALTLAFLPASEGNTPARRARAKPRATTARARASRRGR